MRTWRVGSISMGVSLLGLGLVLLITQFSPLKVAPILIAWWPVILVVLGIEILVYLFSSKQEKSYVKYDFLSILFVGCIGMVGIGLTTLTATGVLEKINEWSMMETKTINLPEYEQPIGKDVKRIVLHTGYHSLTVEESQSNDVNIFGTYRSQMQNQEAAITAVKDYLLIKEKGDTLYIQVKDVYNQMSQPFQDRIDLEAIVLIPSGVKLEMNGEDYSEIGMVSNP